MAGSTRWELYWALSGNPKDGVIIASGSIGPLAAGACQTLTHAPSGSGNYMFKAYQRPGHPGTGEIWSATCELVCTPNRISPPDIAPEPTLPPEAIDNPEAPED